MHVHVRAFAAAPPKHVHLLLPPVCVLLRCHAQARSSVADLTKALLPSWLPHSRLCLKVLPASIQALSALQFLELQGFSHLQELPNAIIKLPALQELCLRDCSSLQALPQDIGLMKSLTVLDLSGCCSLSALPGGLGRLRTLQQLDLQGCSKLAKLPPSVWDLNQLCYYSPPREGGSELPRPPPMTIKLRPLQTTRKTGFTLLSIDGGGMRGLIPGEQGL